MKKFLSVLLALMLLMISASAFAEMSYYVTAAMVDTDGNEMIITEEWPILVFGIEGAEDSNVCAFGTEDEAMEGTYEMVAMEDNEEAILVLVTLADGSEMTLVYSLVDDAFMYVDDEGYTFVMVNMEVGSEAA